MPTAGRALAALLLVLVATYGAGAWAAEEGYDVEAVNLLGEPYRDLVPFDWRFSADDDPAFAERDFDDSAWQTVVALLPPGEPLPTGWSGVGWFRRTISLPPELLGRPLGLRVVHRGAIEVYLDGRLTVADGEVGANPASTRVHRSRIGHPVVFDRGDAVLAVRYANHLAERFGDQRNWAGFAVEVVDLGRLTEPVLNDLLRKTAIQWLFAGIFSSFAVLHLVLFFAHTESREHLHFALVAALFAVCSLAVLADEATTDPHRTLVLGFSMNFLSVALSLALLNFVYSVFYPRRPFVWWLALGLALVLLIAASQASVGAAPWVMAFGLLVTIEMLRSVAVSSVRRRAGSLLLGGGMVLTSVCLGVGLLNLLGLVGGGFVVQFLAFFIGPVFLIVTMSLSLARRIAATSRELSRRLVEVRRLSEEKLVQERRARDEEVRRQVLESEYRQKVAELTEARRLQLSMLPETLPVLPDAALGAAMETATEVGGDYYDFAVEDGGGLTLVIGDATGHGMRAGILVTATKSLFLALAGKLELSSFLARANRALKAMRLARLNMALILGKYSAGRLRLASAGMPPVLVHRAASGEVETLTLEGLPLGALAMAEYHEVELHLERGDTVLLMTDGLPERCNSDGEVWGYERLVESFAGAGSLETPDEVIAAMVAAGAAWAGLRERDDDETLVVLRCGGTEELAVEVVGEGDEGGKP